MTDANADQFAYWNGDAGKRWRAFAAETDAAYAPMARGAIEHAQPRAGERVLDVGCGCGATTLALARRVAPGGTVTGLDLSGPMLGVAGERARAQRIDNVDLIAGDATTHELETGAFDVLFSQFGVMFFADPVAAFSNLRRALASPGRLVFSCWRQNDENPFFAVPVAAARQHIPAAKPASPDAPGPLAFAEPQRVRPILTAAGFTEIEIVPRDTPLRLGDDVDSAVAFTARIGSAGRMIDAAEPAARSAAIAEMRAALLPYVTPDGVFLTAGTWLVSAIPKRTQRPLSSRA